MREIAALRYPPMRIGGGTTMGLIVWIIIGLAAGWIASRIMHGTSLGLPMNLALGVGGAFVGGLVMSLLGGTGVTGLNIWSLLVAVGGACALIWGYGKVKASQRIT
jgi:uncharacterized membrane protein YeaQ/YmgE (transglycosylase-associated protein family)